MTCEHFNLKKVLLYQDEQIIKKCYSAQRKNCDNNNN